MATATADDVANATVTASTAAELLDVSPMTVTNWIRAGRLSAEKRGSGQTEHWAIPVGEVFRERFRPEIRAGTLRELFEDASAFFFPAVNDTLEQAEALRTARNEAFDNKFESAEERWKHLDRLDDAIAALHRRTSELQALRSVLLFVRRQANKPAEILEGEAGGSD